MLEIETTAVKTLRRSIKKRSSNVIKFVRPSNPDRYDVTDLNPEPTDIHLVHQMAAAIVPLAFWLAVMIVAVNLLVDKHYPTVKDLVTSWVSDQLGYTQGLFIDRLSARFA